MAKRGVKPGETNPSFSPVDASSSTPVPPDTLHTTLTSIATGEVLHRVHLSKYQADQFNPGVPGNARI